MAPEDGPNARHIGINALTVDVEEWFHVCGVGGGLSPDNWSRLPSRVVPNTQWLLDLLDRCQIKATFFVLGYVATLHPDLIVTIKEAGHEVASHGHGHSRVFDLTPDAFSRDLDSSFASLRACGVERISAYRAPEWSINDRTPWALDMLARRGIAIDSSMAPLRRVGSQRYPQHVHTRVTPSGPVIECPPAVERRFGQNIPFGGGWGLRRSRPVRVLRSLEARNRSGHSAVFWVHPWEIDSDPPKARLPLPLWFAHYYCLSGFRYRLTEILRGATFAPLSRLAAEGTPGCSEHAPL